VVLSKFVIAAILSLAASGLAATGDEGGFGAVLSGGALLTLAAISPLALLRLVPVVEAGVVSSGSVRGGQTGATGTALGGPGWLYGQAKGWMARNDTTPAPRTWTRTAAALGGAGPVGGAVAVATAGGQALSRRAETSAHGISQLADGPSGSAAPRPGRPASPATQVPEPPAGNGHRPVPPAGPTPPPPRPDATGGPSGR